MQPKRKTYPIWLGGAAASTAASITHPLDLTKYRLQTSISKQGMFKTVIDTGRNEGVRGLWHGLTATLLRQMTYSITRFAVYEGMKEHLQSGPGQPGQSLPAHKLALCAATAGAVAGVTGNPAEIVLVRMCGDLNKGPKERYGYRNCFDGLLRITRDEGVTTLFRGLAPNILRSVLMNVSQLASYDTFKNMLLAADVFHEGPVLHFSASFLAGTFATTVCTPVDVVKSRVQNAAAGKGAGVLYTIRHSLARDGPGVFLRGWTPAWLRLQPQTTLLFLFFEQFKVLYDRLHKIE